MYKNRHKIYLCMLVCVSVCVSVASGHCLCSGNYKSRVGSISFFFQNKLFLRRNFVLNPNPSIIFTSDDVFGQYSSHL